MTIIDAYFYLNAALMIIAATLAMTQKNAVHALLYFILSVLALGISFYLLNAPLAAALEVMVYAGAIMVLFVFVVMLLNIFKPDEPKKPGFFRNFALPIVLAALLALELLGTISVGVNASSSHQLVDAKEVAIALFTEYSLLVEIGSLILLAGLVGALHLGKKSARAK